MGAGEYPQLARSIYYWLNYHSSVSRSDVLLESCIRFPLAEFIERRYKTEVNLEVNHPDFDRLRLDFTYKIADIQRNIEVKFLHDYTDRNEEQKRFFDDLVRLALLDGINYFILCGSWDLYHNKIVKGAIQIQDKKIPLQDEDRPLADNIFNQILPLNNEGEVVEFIPMEFWNYIGGKKNEGNPNRMIPDRLKAVRVVLVSKVDNKDEGSQVVYIWQVISL